MSRIATFPFLFACTAFTDGSSCRKQTSMSVTCQFWHRRETEVLIQFFRNKALIVWGWSAPRSGRFASSKEPGSVYRRQGELRDRSGRAWEISLPLGFGPQTVQPLASRNKDYAIPHCATRPEYLYVSYTNCGGPGSSVGIETELPGWTVRDWIPVGTRFSARPDRPWGPPSLVYNGYRVFPGSKVRPGRAADHSPPSSAAVMEQ